MFYKVKSNSTYNSFFITVQFTHFNKRYAIHLILTSKVEKKFILINLFFWKLNLFDDWINNKVELLSSKTDKEIHLMKILFLFQISTSINKIK